MTILHGYPVGLLSMLGSQNFGVNPKELAEVVSPVVDLSDLYLLQFQQSVSGAVGVPGVGFNLAITVPAGQMWRVHALSGIIVHGAGVTADYALNVMPNNGASVAVSPSISVAANQTRWLPITGAPEGLWLTAGTTIGLDIASLVGVPASLAVSGIFSQIRP